MIFLICSSSLVSWCIVTDDKFNGMKTLRNHNLYCNVQNTNLTFYWNMPRYIVNQEWTSLYTSVSEYAGLKFTTIK